MPSFAALSKIQPDFSNKRILKLKLPKKHFNKKCAPKLLFFYEKKNQEDFDDFLHRKFTLNVQFLPYLAAKLGKASWEAHNQGGWLILKNSIAEGVASEFNDSNLNIQKSSW